MDNEPLFKLDYKILCFEITRRCNMQCSHCMRGPAENHTISKEVIDKTLDEIKSIGELFLTGGEPFLEPEMIEYLFNGIIKRRIAVRFVGIVSNGTIRDKRIADSFNKIGKYVADNWSEPLTKKQIRQIVKISISNDSYHMKEDIMETLNFYRGLLNDNCIILRKNQKDINEVLYLGNAADESFVLEEGKKYRYRITPYRVSFMNDDDGKPIAIDTEIQIGYDGKVLIGDDSSYEQQDRNNYGNILEKHISTLLTEGAFNEPFTAKEARFHDKIYTIYKNKEFTDISENTAKALLSTFEYVYCVRERIHRIYPQIPFEYLVEIAYHELNISLREIYGKYGKEFDFVRIDSGKPFNTPMGTSIAVLEKVKRKYPLETLMGNLLYIKKPVEFIPDSITRERYQRF